MKNIMVCVTQQKTCERLIQYGHDLLDDADDELFIIHVAHYQFKFLGKSKEGEALEYLYEKAMAYGAQLTVVRSNDVLDTLIDLVHKYKITHIILGESGEEKKSNNVVQQLTNRVKKQAEVIVVPAV
ncbi:MAG TPA: universal stress protein [Bacillota bacterium]|nr:universal stress protein [Bacillota bacterium]HPZ59716.1 universal stress protein [Bacillota bacterium]